MEEWMTLLQREFDLQRAERAYIAQLLWCMASRLCMLNGERGCPVPPWFAVFPTEPEEEKEKNAE